MKLTIDCGERSLFVRAIRATRSMEAPRIGLHCSSIINDIVHLNEGKEREPMADPLAFSFQEMGNVVEDVLAEGMAVRLPGWEKPAPRTYEGVISSPDGWSPRIKCIDEIKATWKGTRDFLTLRGADGVSRSFQDAVELCKDQEMGTWEIEQRSPKFNGYEMQTLYYMVPWRAVRARLHVFFINGNYRPPFPEPVTFNLRPSEEEIAMNYRKIMQHARDRGMMS